MTAGVPRPSHLLSPTGTPLVGFAVLVALPVDLSLQRGASGQTVERESPSQLAYQDRGV